MQARNRSPLPTNEAYSLAALIVGRGKSCPQLLSRRSVMNVDVIETFAFQREHNILVLHLFRPSQFCEMFWTPSFQKAKQGDQALVIAPCKPIAMLIDKCCVLDGGSLAFAGRDAKDIRRFVPQEIRRDARRAFDRLRHGKRPSDALFALAAAQVCRRAGHRAICIQASPSYSPKLPERATDVAESRNSIHVSGCETESRID
jgi:hypothetical protein